MERFKDINIAKYNKFDYVWDNSTEKEPSTKCTLNAINNNVVAITDAGTIMQLVWIIHFGTSGSI